MSRIAVATALAVAVMFGSTAVAEPAGAVVVLEAGTRAHAGTPPCRWIKWNRGVAQRERLIRCAARHWAVPGGYGRAIEIARCESGPGLDPRALYHGSAGVYQHQTKYWRARAVKYLAGPRWKVDEHRVPVWNAWANVVVSFMMASDPDIGWGPWSCAS